jgi:phosphopantetheinyl transferase
VWKIVEEETFFLKKVPLHRAIVHPHKRLQHLAGRYLLQMLFPHFPISLIKIADTFKPFLEDETFNFSISHCADFAAAIVSTEKRVGVDIEVATPKIEKIQYRFSGKEEIDQLQQQWVEEELIGAVNQQFSYNELLTLLWSVKEAVYKWYGRGGVDFRDHIVLKKIKQISLDSVLSEICFSKETPISLLLTSRFFEGAVLSYVVT